MFSQKRTFLIMYMPCSSVDFLFALLYICFQKNLLFKYLYKICRFHFVFIFILKIKYSRLCLSQNEKGELFHESHNKNIFWYYMLNAVDHYKYIRIDPICPKAHNHIKLGIEKGLCCGCVFVLYNTRQKAG